MNVYRDECTVFRILSMNHLLCGHRRANPSQCCPTWDLLYPPEHWERTHKTHLMGEDTAGLERPALRAGHQGSPASRPASHPFPKTRCGGTGRD